MKNKSLLLLLFCILSANMLNGQPSRPSSTLPSGPQSSVGIWTARPAEFYYSMPSTLDRNYAYQLTNKKKRLKMMSNEMYAGSGIVMFGVIIANSILSVENEWPLWIDIPVASIAAVGLAMPFFLLGNSLSTRSDAIVIPTDGNKWFDYTYMSDLNRRIHLTDSVYGSSSPEYAEILLLAAKTCADAGDAMQAKTLLDESGKIFKKNGTGSFNGRDTICQILFLDTKSSIDAISNAELRSLREAKQASELKQLYLGDRSSVYLSSVLDVSRLYAERFSYRKSHQWHNRGYGSYVELIRDEFCRQSESGRALYWQKAKPYIDKTLEVAWQSAGHGDEMAGAAYNALLLSKGLLLNTTLEFENYILHSGNTQAMALLGQRKALGKDAPTSAKDSLDFAILDALRDKGQNYNIPHLFISWQDVQSHLQSDDLCVEFFRTAAGNYGAILLRKDWSSPRTVQLAGAAKIGGRKMPLDEALHTLSLEHYSGDIALAYWNISKSVWTDEIVDHFPMSDTGRVFFSADGELQTYGIEYLPFSKASSAERTDIKTQISDLYHLFRLSSTRSLAGSDNSWGNGAAIYGGLDYDAEIEAVHLATKHTTPIKRDDTTSRVRAAIGDFDYLEGTRNEAIKIAAICDSITTLGSPHLYTNDKGGEESFKQLSGTGKRLIHIATHGFFYSDADTAAIKTLQLGDDPMMRSGLVMSGGNALWFGDNIPEGSDDGLLTSHEISLLDLRGLELVTLSACETAKGDLRADGVFGLQRGFKMAGAGSILMSLWKVDDEATSALMTEFYRLWTGGLSKRDALKAAQNSLRDSPRWSNPKYWAAFILLDAIK